MSLSLDRFNFDQARFIARHQALWTTQEGKPHLVYLKCDCIDDCLKHFLDTVRMRILQAQKDPSIRCYRPTSPQARIYLTAWRRHLSLCSWAWLLLSDCKSLSVFERAWGSGGEATTYTRPLFHSMTRIFSLNPQPQNSSFHLVVHILSI